MLDKYTTIEKEVNGEIVEKKSKFIANIFPVESEDEAFQKLEEVRKLHRDARHNVFVYRLANGNERASDDGEPSGTAGVPILDILRGMKLQNILVVVTRYFGGILLGTGGLVRAYTDSTKEALQKAKFSEKVLKIEYKIEIPYSYYDKISHFCRKSEYPIVDSTYSDTVQVFVVVEKNRVAEFEKQITELSDRTAIVKIEKDEYYS